MPSDRTLYRLFGTLSHGRHVTGSASTRRSLVGRPEGMFGSLPAAAPGEVVQVAPPRWTSWCCWTTASRGGWS